MLLIIILGLVLCAGGFVFGMWLGSLADKAMQNRR